MLGKMLAKILFTALALILISYLIPGITVTSFPIALLAALVFGILNVIVRPLLLLLALPINLLTLGIFTLFINGFLFWFATKFVEGFEVSGYLAAFIGAIVLTALSWLADQVLE